MSFDFSGSCEYLSPPPTLELGSESLLFENVGRLLCFATLFGIIDLHVENVLIYPTHAQLIDIECLFFSSETPLDTLLIHNRATAPDRNLIYALRQLDDGLTAKRIEAILNGLVGEFQYFLEHAKTISSILEISISGAQKVPIRVLLRSTMQYNSEFPAENLLFPMIDAEKSQLARGDVPYFFGFLGDHEVYFYEKPGLYQKVPNRDLFPVNEKISRSFTSPQLLFTSERLIRVFKQSLMIVASKLISAGESVDISSQHFKLHSDGKILQIQCASFALQSFLTPR